MKIDEYGAHPRTIGELTVYVNNLLDEEHDYNTAVEAITSVALAAFNYACYVVGASGAQASFADLNFLAKTRAIKSGVMITNFDDLLYPQYDLEQKLREAIKEYKPRVGKMAVEKLKEIEAEGATLASPDVIRRWKELALYAEIDDRLDEDSNRNE